MSITSIQPRKFWQDPSTWLLIIANIVIIVLALKDGWNLLTLMWVYWVQSVIIGVINVIRIFALRDFSTTHMRYRDGTPIPNTKKEKIVNAFFFLVHYGFFQVCSAIMIWNASYVFKRQFEPPELLPIYISAGIFLANHLFSFLYHYKDLTKKQELGNLMAVPYIRIIPMHFVVFLMVLIPSPLASFLLLRTVADVSMHAIEHYNKKNYFNS